MKIGLVTTWFERGEAQERRARPDLAYDAYRRAVELNPDEHRARKRLTEMERAAGFD